MAAANETLHMMQFEDKLRKAMQDVKLILDSEKSMVLPQQTHHTYEDKFHLVERCSLVTLASHWNTLEQLGLTKETLLETQSWADGNAEVSLRFRAEERCDYLQEETREVEEPSCGALDLTTVGAALGLISKTVTRVTEYIWNFEVTYTLELLCGEVRRRLAGAVRSTHLRSNAKRAPRVTRVPAMCEEMNITFFLKHLHPSGNGYCPCFEIPRDSAKTKTPRRNQQVEEMLIYANGASNFLRSMKRYLTELQGPSEVQITKAIFVPSLPLFRTGDCEHGDGETETRMCVRLQGRDAPGSCVMSSADCNRLLEEEMRSFEVKKLEVLEELAIREELGVFSVDEAVLRLAVDHGVDVLDHWRASISFIEGLLYHQLTACIGRSITPGDVDSYMRFHNRKLFAPPYQPVPLSHSVRRSESHCAEGAVSIEEGGGGAVCCMTSRKPGAVQMKFALNASTSVSFAGDLYLHAWMVQRFGGGSGSRLSLVSRARQFSCFMVLLGKVISRNEFDPTYAFLLQNKDELQIPLELSTIPTPKEFKDAIESLSPEQQQFAKAFRAMQLESTLFGILVVQIKPQLEQLLHLPSQALTKEIKLTQDLLQLFIKYQIPSDLLSFSKDLDAEADPQSRIAAVRAHVEEMLGMIKAEQQKEIEEKRRGARFQLGHGCYKQNELSIEELEQKVTRLKSISHHIRMVEDTMSRNVDAVLDRGESLEVLMQKSNDLSSTSKCFYKTARSSNSFFDGIMGRRAPAAAPGGAPPAGGAPPVVRAAPVGGAPPAGGAPPVGGAAPVTSKSCSGKAERAVSPHTNAAEAMRAPKDSTSSAPPPSAATSETDDVTQLPRHLDQRLEQLELGTVRPTIITAGESWTKRSQPLLSAPLQTETMGKEQIRKARADALDLLDALTKSGALPLSHAELHVVICASHCFDKTVMDTVIQENLNPIEQLELSNLLLASTVHALPVSTLLQSPAAAQRLEAKCPELMAGEEP